MSISKLNQSDIHRFFGRSITTDESLQQSATSLQQSANLIEESIAASSRAALLQPGPGRPKKTIVVLAPPAPTTEP
jgi:hypothetical protein